MDIAKLMVLSIMPQLNRLYRVIPHGWKWSLDIRSLRHYSSISYIYKIKFDLSSHEVITPELLEWLNQYDDFTVDKFDVADQVPKIKNCDRVWHYADLNEEWVYIFGTTSDRNFKRYIPGTHMVIERNGNLESVSMAQVNVIERAMYFYPTP